MRDVEHILEAETVKTEALTDRDDIGLGWRHDIQPDPPTFLHAGIELVRRTLLRSLAPGAL